MPGHPNDELLRRWQETGDAESLDGLLRSEIATLKGMIAVRGRDLMGSSASPSDIAQEAVLRMLQLETIPHFTDARALRGYLWVTAWRLLLNRISRPYRHKAAIDLGASSQLPPELVARPASDGAAEAASEIEFAMNLMPPVERDLIHDVYVEGLKIADLARRDGVSESAIKMRLFRARRMLAGKLAAWDDVLR